MCLFVRLDSLLPRFTSRLISSGYILAICWEVQERHNPCHTEEKDDGFHEEIRQSDSNDPQDSSSNDIIKGSRSSNLICIRDNEVFSTARNRCWRPRRFHTTPRRSTTGRDIERQILFYCPRFPVSTSRRLDPLLSGTALLNESDLSRDKTGKRSSVSIFDRERW